jgi:ATP-dependent exoDNAse (exonuclease V) beta subunit
MKSAILEFLLSPPVAPFFAVLDGRNIMNEQEFVSPEGRLFRMDRIVVDTDTVTVLDFKTGDDNEAYTHQLEGYIRILEDFYPGRAVHGVLAFVERKKLRVIA